MAQPSTEAQHIRNAVTRLSNVYSEMGPLLQRYQDFGADFYNEYLADAEGNPTTDITAQEFHDAIGVLAAVIGGLTQDQRQKITKLRI